MDPRGSLLRLSWTFGITWLCVTMVAAPGPAAWVALSGSSAQAGAYFGINALAGAVGAALGGRAMDRWGRRPVLVGAHLQAALGFAVAGLAYVMGSLVFFAIGTALSSSSLGVIYLTRLAAAELAAPSERARTVARVQVSAAVAAVAGPFVLVPIAFGVAPLGLAPDPILWAIASAAFLIAATVVSGAHALRGPSLARSIAPASDARIPWLPFAAGMAALVCAQAAMVTVMGVTGVHLRHQYGGTTTALVMASHFLGMFGLSLVVGRLADRAGRAATIVAGLGLLAVGGIVVALLEGRWGLGAGLLLVGLGWSFAYIAGTVLLTDVVPAERRGRTLGAVDFTTAILTASASFAGGAWYAREGISGLGLASAALAALPIVLVLFARRPSGAATALPRSG